MQFLPFEFGNRANLKPVAGDLLDFQGVLYVAEQIGLKYIVAHLASDPKVKGLLKIQHVSKVVAPEETPTADGLMDIAKQFPGLARRH